MPSVVFVRMALINFSDSFVGAIEIQCLSIVTLNSGVVFLSVFGCRSFPFSTTSPDTIVPSFILKSKECVPTPLDRRFHQRMYRAYLWALFYTAKSSLVRFLLIQETRCFVETRWQMANFFSSWFTSIVSGFMKPCSKFSLLSIFF